MPVGNVVNYIVPTKYQDALAAVNAGQSIQNNLTDKNSDLSTNTNSNLLDAAASDTGNLIKGLSSSNEKSSIINDKFESELKLNRNRFENAKNQYYKSYNDTDAIFKKLLQDVSLNYGTKSFAPHINGYHHVSIQAGEWIDGSKNDYYVVSDDGTATVSQNRDIFSYKNMSGDNNNELEIFQEMNGTYITDIDIPQLSLEYESVSGKQRSLNYATRINYASDFSITYINDFNNNVMKFHDAQFKYIDLYRKGYVKYKGADKSNEYFIDVPYFNAVWVAIFKPFTLKIACLIKIMGVAPINLPFKQLLGDRSKPTITTLNVNYKSTDIFWKFYSDNVNISSEEEPFLQEYLKHITKTIDGYHHGG